ncbi:GH21695 [Drosophila grimshawi]|uniref:U3 small nucleolar RNA-associated protein 25 homolog n=2 Tax=Drosophila grimshawi TaxID=7222 RepID=B4J651_DROGR|nr:GH21695 [Drosophila grimshawi]
MEQLHKRATQYQSTVSGEESKMTVNQLPSVKDENEFYEQLVSEYRSAAAPTITESNRSVLLRKKVKDVKNQEERDPTDLKPYNSFSERLNFDLTSDDITEIISKITKVSKAKWSSIGKFQIEVPILKSTTSPHDNDYNKQPPETVKSTDLQIMDVKMSLAANVAYPLSALQIEILQIANNYLDLYYPQRTHANAEEIRYVYCLHAVNHMLKTRALILRNNEKIAGLVKYPNQPLCDVAIPDSLRDQGLKRMKALILLPFRESALKTVQIMASLLFPKQKGQNATPPIAKYDRFLNDFSGNTIYFPKTNPKPFDYEQTFSGNTDDNFKLGIRFTKKSMSLYTDISGSDILIASPLALRMMINDKDQDYDFLNSIELLIIDQAELFIAQNWENLLYVLDHLHLQPQKLPDTNCQRVRQYCLSGTSRFYRQTLFFSSHELPEFRGLFNNKCHNYQGKVRIINQIARGDISNVLTPIEQVFQRIDCSSVETAFDDRFQHFVGHILPECSKSGLSHCLLYVPSYFDYVRLRNHFKNEMINFVQISEYTKKEKISRARDIFFHSGAPFLLYSERAHFFRRTRIKGIRHLIFYQPPNFPNFYSDLINLMLEVNQNPRDGLQDVMSVKVFYSKFDTLSLSNIVGNENASKLALGTNDSYLFSNKK